MDLRSRLLITALAAAGLAVVHFGQSDAELGGHDVGAVHFHLFGDPLEREGMVYARDTVALLAARNYDGLEARARVAREEKQRFADGTWKLCRFYAALPLAQCRGARPSFRHARITGTLERP